MVIITWLQNQKDTCYQPFNATLQKQIEIIVYTNTKETHNVYQFTYLQHQAMAI